MCVPGDYTTSSQGVGARKGDAALRAQRAAGYNARASDIRVSDRDAQAYHIFKSSALFVSGRSTRNLSPKVTEEEVTTKPGLATISFQSNAIGLTRQPGFLVSDP